LLNDNLADPNLNDTGNSDVLPSDGINRRRFLTTIGDIKLCSYEMNLNQQV